MARTPQMNLSMDALLGAMKGPPYGGTQGNQYGNDYGMQSARHASGGATAGTHHTGIQGQGFPNISPGGRGSVPNTSFARQPKLAIGSAHGGRSGLAKNPKSRSMSAARNATRPVFKASAQNAPIFGRLSDPPGSSSVPNASAMKTGRPPMIESSSGRSMVPSADIAYNRRGIRGGGY